MEFFSQTYVALRGPQGAPQTAQDTIGKLSDRLSPSTLLADRRAAVLSLKGLVRDCKQEVGERTLPGLLEALENDAEVDTDIAKAVLETLNALCDSTDGATRETGLKHSDVVLATDKSTHKLFALLGDQSFYVRFPTLQLLGTLLHNRRQIVQAYFLKAPAGPSGIISVLEDKRDIVRNEAMIILQALTTQNADIQKVLAFEGAFEKLFIIIRQERGVEGGLVARDALQCVDGLLRFNTSNQSYFRETPFPPELCALLLFPPGLPPQSPVPQEFALQLWDTLKTINVGFVVGIIGMLAGAQGSSPAELAAFTRCLIELALASNAPTTIKTQALKLLPVNVDLPLTTLILVPYMPVPETNGEEWDRLEPVTTLDMLIELALHGEYGGTDGMSGSKNGLELRMAALGIFETAIRRGSLHESVLQAMLPSQDPQTPPPVSPLLVALTSPPTSPLDLNAVTSTHFASLLMAHLLRGSPSAKALARRIMPPKIMDTNAGGGQFFVPADGAPPSAAPEPEPVPEDDEPQTILQILSENLSLAFLSRARADTSDRETREWDRLVVGYLCLLSEWLWEDAGSVRDFLEAGALGMLVEPINQTSEADVVVPALCAFLLGVCYEFNREPGEVTRATIHPILSRLGVDTLVGKMTRFREDDRFRSVTPESAVLATMHLYPASRSMGVANGSDVGAEVWFDWPFVDFWKSNAYIVQRAIGLDPNTLASTSGQNAESAMLVASLRDVISKQAQELDDLRQQLHAASINQSQNQELSALQEQVASLTADVQSSQEKQKDAEKEQEDLLVLLDELSSKRKADKARMREAGLEVSDDEGEGEDEDEDE